MSALLYLSFLYCRIPHELLRYQRLFENVTLNTHSSGNPDPDYVLDSPLWKNPREWATAPSPRLRWSQSRHLSRSRSRSMFAVTRSPGHPGTRSRRRRIHGTRLRSGGPPPRRVPGATASAPGTGSGILLIRGKGQIINYVYEHKCNWFSLWSA